MFIFAASLSQSLKDTWQAGLKVYRYFPSDLYSAPCETLLLKTASIIHDKLTKVETLERYASFLTCFSLCFKATSS